MANISQVQLPSGVSYPIKAPAIPYGAVDSTSTATVFTATVPGITELTDGTVMMLHNGVVTSASGFTVNINNLGAKKCYNNMTNATQDTTIFNAAYTMIFVYSEALDGGNGGWWIYRGYDGNTNTIGYQLRTNSGNKVAADTGYKYRLWFTSADSTKWVPANTSTSTNATTNRTLNTRAIDPFGPIVYRATNGTCTVDAGLGATGIWQQYTLTIGYSYMQTGFSLTFPAPVFVKCTPQTDGSVVMDSIVQALPSSKDGKIYIYLGTAYSATSMELEVVHPVYYHDGNGVKFWTGSTIPTVSAVANLSSGTQVGTITVDGTTTTFYAPTAGGGGTVTSVGVSNATDGGLSVSGSPITTSGTITVGHSNVLSSAQTTEAVYPIKIDKNGHISSYGTAVTVSDTKVSQALSTSNDTYSVLFRNATGTSNSTDTSKFSSKFTVQASTGNLTAGTINGYTLAAASAKAVDTSISAGSSSANLPTSAAVANFVEGKGYSTTDEKLKVETATSGTTYYPVLSTSGTTASTKQIDSTGLSYYASGSASAKLTIGNGTKRGMIELVNSSNYSGYIEVDSLSPLTGVRHYYLPDASGTFALTSDITTAVLTATDDGAGNVTLSVTGVTSANLNSASGVSF